MPVTEEVPVLSASEKDSSTRALPQSAVFEPQERVDTSVAQPVDESVDSAPQRDLIMQMTNAVPVAMPSTDDLVSPKSTKRKSVATASKMRCPARGCKKRVMEEELACHWRNAHESQVVLWLCPMHRCNQRFRSVVQLSIHLHKCHKVTRPEGRKLDKLTPLSDLVDNNTYKFPGVARPSYAVEPTLPQGALRHLMKVTLQGEVEAILKAKDSTSNTSPLIPQQSPLTDERQGPWFPLVPPPLPPAPPQLPPAPEPREKLPPILDGPLGPQPPAFPPGPSAPPQLPPLPLCAQVQQPDPARHPPPSSHGTGCCRHHHHPRPYPLPPSVRRCAPSRCQQPSQPLFQPLSGLQRQPSRAPPVWRWSYRIDRWFGKEPVLQNLLRGGRHQQWQRHALLYLLVKMVRIHWPPMTLESKWEA